MNLTALRQKIAKGDLSIDALRFLLSCRAECEWLDYKEELHLDDERGLADFTRDVLAFKNMGGGYIVVGVQDKTWQPLGLKEALPYDKKLLSDKVRRACGLDVSIDIVQPEVELPGSRRRFALILVRAAKHLKKLAANPARTDRDFGDRQYGFRFGEIYARKGDQTVRIKSGTELASLHEQMEGRAAEDSLLESLPSSPFAVEDYFYRLLEKGFETFVGRRGLREQILTAVTQDPRIWIINVHGPGGVGKSALVNWAVYQFYDRRAEHAAFESIIQLSGKDTALTATGIIGQGRSLYSLEQLLDHLLATFAETPPPELEEKRRLAINILRKWRTLLVLDNMETVQDDRILDFARRLPPDSQAKVLLTSRRRTGGWELPFPVRELDAQEVQEFLAIKAPELNIEFPTDANVASRVLAATGGLPLAIQWLLGRFKLEGSLTRVLDSVSRSDSPVLEFSFRGIWAALSGDAKSVLAVLSIFDEPPTVAQLIVAMERERERLETALEELADVTLVTRDSDPQTGQAKLVALPITLEFAKHELKEMGGLGEACRRRVSQYEELRRLEDREVKLAGRQFLRFGLETDSEKRAGLLCNKGQSDFFLGNVESARVFFQEAREMAPQSAYVYAMSASFELAQRHVEKAREFANEACKLANAQTASLAFKTLAEVLKVSNDRKGRAEALGKATDCEPNNSVLRHQYGVALSQAGRVEDAIRQFDEIIANETKKPTPGTSILYALKTRILNNEKLGKKEAVAADRRRATELREKYAHLAAVEFDRS